MRSDLAQEANQIGHKIKQNTNEIKRTSENSFEFQYFEVKFD